MNKEAATKITKARIALISEQVFYGTLALRLHMVEMSDEMLAHYKAKGMKPTMAVDGKSIFYSADFVNSLEHAQVKTVIAHEVGHCVFDHIGRRQHRQPVKWNQAGDYIINGLLDESGFESVDGWLRDKAYDNMTADHVYSLLPDPPSSGGKDGNGGALCDILGGPSADDPSMVDDWKVATAQAANVAKMAGKLPANLARFVNEILNPKADWRTMLRRFVTEQNKDDYSWRRPNKRLIHAGYYMPSLWSEGMGEIDIVVDTSGSITQKMLDVFQAEIQSIRDSVRPRLTRIIYCDSHINHIDEFAAEDLLEMKMHGGGGTSFIPPFDYIAEHGHRPAAFLYLTDLYGQAPAEAPDYPVMWCCTTNEAEPWGERVEIEVD